MVNGWTAKRREKAEEIKAVAEYFCLKRINQDWIKDQLVEVIEHATQSSAKVSAIKLICQMLGLLKDHSNARSMQDAMPVYFHMRPATCPACGYDYNSPEALATEAKAEQVHDGDQLLLEDGGKGEEE